MRTALVALMLVTGCECGGVDAPDTAVGELPAPTLRILAITDLQGTLEPCGCTSRPLGGIDRLVEAVQQERGDVPTLFVAAGDLLAGGPSHGGPESGETDAWRAATLAGALGDAGLDAAPGGEADHDRDALEVALFAPGQTDVLRELGPMKVALLAVRQEVAPELAGRIQQLRADGAALVVALVDGDRRLSRNVAELEGVDFVVQGGVDSEEPLPPQQGGAGWLLHASRQGQGLLVLDYYAGEGSPQNRPLQNVSSWSVDVERSRLEAEVEELEAQLETWESEGAPAEQVSRQRSRLAGMQGELEELAVPALEGAGFAARFIELDPDMPRNDAVRTRLAALDERINVHNRSTFADRMPAPVDEGDPHYVGSTACSSCHQAAYSWWQGHAHGNAYATLQERNKEFHLECVGCHVTGYERPGGSTVTHNLEGALVNVGCENCHGPGSQHIAAPSEHVLAAETPESTCVQCHNEEHSDQFVYDIYRQTLLVPGHGRPE